MTLLSCLLPASPPEPRGARVVRPLGEDAPRKDWRTSKQQKWREKNRAKVQAYDRERWARR